MTRTDLEQAVARAIHELRRQRGFAQALWEHEPPGLQSLHIAAARAALSAIEGAGLVLCERRVAERALLDWIDP